MGLRMRCGERSGERIGDRMRLGAFDLTSLPAVTGGDCHWAGPSSSPRAKTSIFAGICCKSASASSGSSSMAFEPDPVPPPSPSMISTPSTSQAYSGMLCGTTNDSGRAESEGGVKEGRGGSGGDRGGEEQGLGPLGTRPKLVICETTKVASHAASEARQSYDLMLLSFGCLKTLNHQLTI